MRFTLRTLVNVQPSYLVECIDQLDRNSKAPTGKKTLKFATDCDAGTFGQLQALQVKEKIGSNLNVNVPAEQFTKISNILKIGGMYNLTMTVDSWSQGNASGVWYSIVDILPHG